MFAEERHQAIRQLVAKHRRLSVAELQRWVAVSPATLRRDLTDLEKRGEILRVHGGVLDPAYVRGEITLDEKVLRNGAAKKAIAKKTVDRIAPGSTVFVDAGSTCLEAGKLLLARKDIRILTHSVALTALALRGEAEFVCIGGELRRVSGALVGGNAIEALSYIHVDYALLGASGLDEEGCWTTELTEAEVKKAILTRCRNRLVLADASKWKTPSTIRFALWKEVDAWICEDETPEGVAFRDSVEG